MSWRKHKEKLKGQAVALGDDTVMQPLPYGHIRRHSPFILLHHFGPKSLSPETRNLHVPPHPHRGFEPVTFVFSGALLHKDSLGNESRVGAGGAQWISAGRGIVHSEEAASDAIENEDMLELIQLWINLPAAKKMQPAKYMEVKANDVTFIEVGGGKMGIIGGAYKGASGPVDPATPLLAAVLELNRANSAELDLSAGHNVLLYDVSGKFEINEGELQLEKYEGVIFEPASGKIKVESKKDGARMLVLSGEPIDEPMAQYGPFVMNNQKEILEALRDHQQGKMGILV